MNRSQLMLIALVAYAALSPCHADAQAVAANHNAPSALKAPNQAAAAKPGSPVSTINRVTLNPQPLPPGSRDPKRMRANPGMAAEKAQNAGIIIIGGAPATKQ